MTQVVTNSTRIREGIGRKAANALLVKPNQIGTLTETLAAVELAKENGMKIVMSHRSGETGGHKHRGYCRCRKRRVHQIRRAVPQRPHRKIQPPAAHCKGK